MIVTSRERPQTLAANAPDRVDIALGPLAADDAARLLDELVGTAAELAPIREAIQSRAEGNPFFLEETVAAFVDAGVLAGVRGAMRPGHAPAATPRIPTTVHAVLAARIDGLDAHDKRVLQAASVIGRRFDFTLLGAATGLARGELDATVARLRWPRE